MANPFGRPKVENPRRTQIAFRVTDYERKRIEDAALKAGVSLSAFVLGCVLGESLGQTIIDGVDGKKSSSSKRRK